jgi:HEAT repeat protein
MRAPFAFSLSVAFILATVGRGMAQDEKPPDYTTKTVAEWIKVLKHESDPKLSAVARRALGPNGPYAKTAIPALIDALEEKKWELRKPISETLADYGSPVVPSLVRALKSSDAPVRAGAAEALGGVRQRPKEAVPALIEAMKETNREVRGSAGHSLAVIGLPADKKIPELIATVLRDDDPDVRYWMVFCLSQMDHKAAPAVPAIISALKDNDKSVRDTAVKTLGTIGPAAKGAVPALIEALQNKKISYEETNILRAFQYIGPAAKDAVPALIEVLKKYPDGWTTGALGAIGPDAKAAVPELIKLAKHNDSHYRYDAIQALGQIGPAAKDAVPLLLELLDKPGPKVPVDTIVDALGAIGPDAKAAVPKLMAMARDLEAQPPLRRVAAFAVIKIDPELAAKENMEIAYINIRVGKIPDMKLAPRATVTDEQKKSIKALIAKLAGTKETYYGMGKFDGRPFAPVPGLPQPRRDRPGCAAFPAGSDGRQKTNQIDIGTRSHQKRRVDWQRRPVDGGRRHPRKPAQSVGTPNPDQGVATPRRGGGRRFGGRWLYHQSRRCVLRRDRADRGQTL